VSAGAKASTIDETIERIDGTEKTEKEAARFRLIRAGDPFDRFSALSYSESTAMRQPGAPAPLDHTE
jgi:hypothetical protein